MDIFSTIFAAAKAAGVSGTLLLAICAHESNNFTLDYNANDKGSPSYGYCQIKYDTAYMVGFRGKPYQLKEPKINALYAAMYLRYQYDRYGDQNWVALTSSYNAGSYVESVNHLGCPKNLEYVRMVRLYLKDEDKERLNCGKKEY